METLNSIVIKNIRRFADVTIDVGPGATIFYAPNGTGKTSIFESIELALTGKVKRLDNDFKPLMRDQSTDSSVRLNFTSGSFCQAQLKRGSQPVLTGDYDKLLNKIPRENVPYLLRLTHLLNQSADGWFVQSRSSSDAGAQLDHLSIGREATQAKTVITGTKRAATAIKDENQKELNDAKDALDKWFTLLNKRNASINLEPSRPLVSYEELFSSINNIAKSFNYNRLVFKGDISLIRNQYNEIASILAQVNEEASNRLIELNAIKPVVVEYANNIKQSTEYRRANAILLEEKTRIEYTIQEFNIELTNEEKKFSIYTINQKRSKEKLDRVHRALELESNILALAEQIDLHTAQVSEITEVYNKAKKGYADALEVYNMHQLLFKREVGLAERKSFLAVQLGAVEQWRELDKSIIQLINELRPDFLLEWNKDNEALKGLTEQRNEQRVIIAEAQRVFDAINIANDAIISAVGVVISTISPETGNCPVCTQQYEPAELQRRMNVALNAISPELQYAASKLDDAKGKLSRIEKKIFASNSKLIKSAALLNNVDERIAILQSELSHLINNTFPGIDSIDVAAEQLRQASMQNEAAIQELESQKRLVASPPSSEELAIVQNSIDTLGFSLSTTVERLRALERTRDKSLDDSNDEIASLSVEEFVEMVAVVETESANISNSETAINAISKEIEQKSRLLESKASEIDSLNKQVLNISAAVNRYKAQWGLLKLPQEPSEDLLAAEIILVLERLSHVENSFKILGQLEIEISRWLSIAEHSIVEREINEAKGILPEIEYTSFLNDKVEQLTKKQRSIQSKIATLNNFSTRLGHELDGVHEIIKSINPLWNKLLKRIVIDPRFSETVLDSYSSYNKQHANVNVPLHGGNILAHHVASEAQITDLQLTFLLALAQNYEWTPWRALLLDDPTQHHDLVHASAVFDLLRDYIAEKEFQVLLATHDSVQAKFFMRKLQNDGIPARICTLQSTSAGVVPLYKES